MLVYIIVVFVVLKTKLLDKKKSLPSAGVDQIYDLSSNYDFLFIFFYKKSSLHVTVPGIKVPYWG